ncbi:MAG: RagB/SusD family nutrient uptake outer membrane protein [Draconibacterium sp.]
MKKLNYIAIVTGLFLFMASCQDFLDENVIDSVSVDYVYTTPTGIETGVNALYNLHREYNFPSRTQDGLRNWVFFRVGTDLGLSRGWWIPYNPQSMTPLNFPSLYWRQAYQILDRANAIVSNARNVDMDIDKKNELIAQARLVRGETYFNLLRAYDNILLDTIATTSDNVFDEVDYTPANPDDVYRLIDSDFDFAIKHLSWDNDYGKFGQGMARHLRGQSAMWQGDWDEAVIQFDAIVESGRYKLLDNIGQVFGQNANHSEAIMVYPRNEALGGEVYLAGGDFHQLPGLFVARWYEIPTKEVIRSVENGGQVMGWEYPNSYLQSLYDPEVDKRFETYYYPLKLFVNNPDKPNYGEPLPESSYPDNYRQYHWSLKKFHDINKSITGNQSYKDMIRYRYAETLLLGAEAHWRASGENPANVKALEYINLVRERAGVPDFETFDQEKYLEESARELAFEGNRWFLLKRMGLLVERQNLHYRRGGNSNSETTEPMPAYMVRLPIPQSQIDLMGGVFPQNQGYE